MTNTPKIIGITGNIATGKSVVGHMLANSGALEIDADVVANRMLYPSGPSYHPVLKAFGEKILTESGLISRQKLGEIVFPDPEKLLELEKLLHPAVTTSIQARIKITSQPVVVIEAIKLLESNLVDICDAIWVSDASIDHQMERLINTRNMTRTEALSRISAQPLQSEKLNRANVVINTEGSFIDTWQQIQDALNDTIQLNNGQNEAQTDQPGDWYFPFANALSDETAASFWNSWTDKDPEIWYEFLGTKLILPFIKEDRLKSLLFWDNWNFTAALSRWISQKAISPSSEFVLDVFSSQVEKQECEVILFSNQMVKNYNFDLDEFGFKFLKISEIPYPAWQEAARKDSQDHDDRLWIKVLSQPVEAKGPKNRKPIIK